MSEKAPVPGQPVEPASPGQSSTGRLLAAIVCLVVAGVAALAAAGGIVLVALGQLHPLYVVNIALQLGIAALFAAVALGRYWAWIAAQGALAVNVAAAVVLGLVKPALLPAGFYQYLVAVLVWVWLRETPVRMLCKVPPQPKPEDIRFVCRKCGKVHAAGAWRCPACRVPLRPAALNIVTLVAMVAIPAGILAMLILRLYRPVEIAQMALGVLGVGAVVGLRYGRYWAWLGIQLVMGLSLVLAFGRASEGRLLNANLAGAAAIQAVVFGALWYYLTRPRTIAFCSIGRDDHPGGRE